MTPVTALSTAIAQAKKNANALTPAAVKRVESYYKFLAAKADVEV